MRSLLVSFLLILSYQFLLAQQASVIIDKTGSVHPWNHLNLNNDPDNFQFAIVTDRTGGHRPGVFEDAVQKLNLLQPEFVMSVGDLIEGYTRDEAVIYKEWDEFNGFIKQLQMPFFYVPGNHDYINDVMAKIWEEKYGKSYFHFVYKDVLFLGLNSEEATKGSNMGGIEKAQFKYIKKTLKENPDVKWTLVFMHQPLWILDNTRYWPEVEKLLNKRKHTVFVGHHHHYVKYERNNGKYFMLATTGGGSKLRGPDFGEFDHVVWVTMTDDGPIIANLLLEGIWDEDVVNEEITDLITKSPLRFEPILVESESFSSGEFELKLINDANIPMDYSISIENDEKLTVNENVLDGTVPPNNVTQLKIGLKSEDLQANNDFPSVHLSAIFNYLYEGERNFTIKQNYNYAPSILKGIESSTAKTIDSKLEDWSMDGYDVGSGSFVNGDVSAYKGDEDASFNFKLTYDDDFLYVAVKVKDDEIILDPKKSVWQQDAIRIYMDARPATQSASGTEQNNGHDYLGLFFSPAKSDKDEMTIYQKDLFPENTKLSASYDNEFLYYEAAIPVSWLNDSYGSDWKYLRLNVAITDADNNGSVARLFWQPEWRSVDNIIGSGIFVR